ncbi:MAG: winged helix-turn-helix domain-containing protein [Acidobacteriia bacterium]|nr:winged helix-turn-helix domain-containing protein [Terriglobia bacterium]
MVELIFLKERSYSMQVAQIDNIHSTRLGDAYSEINRIEELVAFDLDSIRFTRMEYRLLAFLAVHAGSIVPRTVLLLNVWGYSVEIRTRTLDAHVCRLRKKLIGFSGQIETIFGVGYRLRINRVQDGMVKMNVA